MVYQGNIIGRNCAGFNPNGTDAPCMLERREERRKETGEGKGYLGSFALALLFDLKIQRHRFHAKEILAKKCAVFLTAVPILSARIGSE
jgi:hypothetical protein